MNSLGAPCLVQHRAVHNFSRISTVQVAHSLEGPDDQYRLQGAAR